MTKSILRKDATIEQDYLLIKKLVGHWIVWDKRHKDSCIEKIKRKIKSQTWQKKYYSKSYIFCLLYSMDVKVSDIKAMIFSQVLETLYIFEWWPEKMQLKDGKSINTPFDEKLKYIFKKNYSQELNPENADILRIVRNNLAHSIEIEWLRNIQDRDKIKITNFLKKYWKETGLRDISISFCYLMEEIILRTLGLENEDFPYNLLSPSKNIFWKSDIR